MRKLLMLIVLLAGCAADTTEAGGPPPAGKADGVDAALDAALDAGQTKNEDCLALYYTYVGRIQYCEEREGYREMYYWEVALALDGCWVTVVDRTRLFRDCIPTVARQSCWEMLNGPAPDVCADLLVPTG